MGLKGVAGVNLAAPGAIGGTTPAAITGTTITANTAFAVDDATSARVTAQNLGTPYVLAKWGVPVALASSGSMADNGAVSAMTALPATYSGGIWLYYPAGAVAAGVPAAASFLWTVMSTTQAGTVYNSTWDGLGVPAVGTTTAFATTGPGAFTGVATGEIVAATVTVPAGAIGPNGSLLTDFLVANNTAAGNKIFRVRFSGGAGTILMSATASTGGAGIGQASVYNGGTAAVQKGGGVVVVGSNAVLGTGPVYPAVDTTAATTLVYTLEKATATNHAILESAVVRLVYGA